ncbi:hypothetical protein HD806DRAFT_523738 [Xylariaceae sp. AK1471]|nr:hypothetical protein HD806DRAFT_523738 [Xylariaceae sp. AK1471]
MAGVALDSDLRATIRRLTQTHQTSPVNMTEPSNGYTVYSDINSQRQVPSESPRRDFYDTFELRAKVPQGFPSMAAMQMQWSNVGTFRTFEYLDWQQLTFCETQLSYLQDLLYKVDVAESKKMKGSQKSRVPFDKNKFMDCCLETPDMDVYGTSVADDDTSNYEFTIVREKLYAHIERISKEHRMIP